VSFQAFKAVQLRTQFFRDIALCYWVYIAHCFKMVYGASSLMVNGPFKIRLLHSITILRSKHPVILCNILEGWRSHQYIIICKCENHILNVWYKHIQLLHIIYCAA